VALNILVIVFDALSAKHPLYGYQRKTMPTWSALRSGLLFTSIVQAAILHPGTADVYGVYPWAHRFIHFRGRSAILSK
jgi:hypothetical protein